MAKSPTQLTMDYLRKRGIPCTVVEKFIKAGKFGIRRDTWAADIQALTRTEIIGIQATSAAHHADRLKKAKEHPDLRLWLAPGRLFWVMSWKKRAVEKGGRETWQPRIDALSIVDGAIVATEFRFL